jgi:P27 family predicted phage terminase small subunit
MSGTRSSGKRPALGSLQLVRGGKPARRAATAPKFDVASGEPPPSLSKEAAPIWQEVAPALRAQGLLTTVDVQLLICYCEAVATYRSALENVRKNGPTVVGARGGVCKNPACTVLDEAAKAIRSFGLDFGMSPAARPRVKAEAISDVTASDFFTEAQE